MRSWQRHNDCSWSLFAALGACAFATACASGTPAPDAPSSSTDADNGALSLTAAEVRGPQPPAPKAYVPEAQIAKHNVARQAEHLARGGDVEGAIAKNKELLEAFPDNPIVENRVATLYGALNSHKEQATWARKALNHDPGIIPAYMNYAEGQAGLGDVPGAERTYMAAMLIGPSSPLPYYGLGLLKERAGEFGEAAANYQRAAELDPQFEDALFHLAAMYSNLGHYDEAVASLQRLLALNPRDEDARRQLAQVEHARARANARQPNSLRKKPPQSR